RRNTILARAARSDLFQRDGVLREIGAGPLRSPAGWLGRGSADSHCSQGTNRSHQHRPPDAVPESQWLAAEDLYFVSAPPDRDLRRLLIIRSTAQQGYWCASLFLLPKLGCPVVRMADAVGQARFILRKRRIGFLFERYSCCVALPPILVPSTRCVV